MGMRMPETCWAVFKWQVINLRSCCIWLVDSVENNNSSSTIKGFSIIHAITASKPTCFEQNNIIPIHNVRLWPEHIIFMCILYIQKFRAYIYFYIQYYECFVSRQKSQPSVSINKTCKVLPLIFLYTEWWWLVESRNVCMQLGFIPAKYKHYLTNATVAFIVYNARGCIASRLFT